MTTIDYSFDRPISATQLQPLLQQTSWAKGRSIDGIQTMLEGTAIVLGAWEDDRLIGFARAITDSAYRALIDDVVIDTPKRGQGIGSSLMHQLVKRLTEMEVEEVFLRCGDQVVPFYQRLGFETSDGITMDLGQD